MCTNMDQTIVHLIYAKRGSPWVIVGAKHNLVLKIKYNRQIVTIISSSIDNQCYLCKFCFKGQPIMQSSNPTHVRR